MVPREVLTLQRSYASPALPRCVSVALCPPGKGPEAPLSLDRGPAHSASEPLRGTEWDTEVDKAWRGAFPSKTFRTPGGVVGDGWTHWRCPTGTLASGPALSGLPCCSSLVGGLLWDGPRLIPMPRAKSPDWGSGRVCGRHAHLGSQGHEAPREVIIPEASAQQILRESGRALPHTVLPDRDWGASPGHVARFKSPRF